MTRHQAHARGSSCSAAFALLLLVACDAGSEGDPPSTEDGGVSSSGNDADAGEGPRDEQGSNTGNPSGGPQTDGGSAVTIDPGAGAGNGGSSSGSGGTGAPAPSLAQQVCRGESACFEIGASAVDKVDLLFMVDDSGSMREEQAALAAQFPELLRALTSGDLDGDGESEAAPASSLHLGVVSSDLGLVGIGGIDKCMGLGDDGVLNDLPSQALDGCASEYPRFMSYQTGVDDPDTASTDLACIATLGTEGCGFEQQLESALKAVWPFDDDRIVFLPDPQGFGSRGQGANGGMNDGFLRSDPAAGLSVVAIVVVTDEEDCSSKDTRHFRPPAVLDPNNPEDQQLLNQGLNVRCNFNPQNLYTKERYINGFKALRPEDERLVVFGAIVGVPADAAAELPADYADEAAREAFYEGIVNHPSMQPMVDTLGTAPPDDDVMVASCNTASGKAYPPPRIVEVARGFGENGIVQSICQQDFGPPVRAIAGRIAARLGQPCLPRPLVRAAGGEVGCEVFWALPAPSQAAASAPTACSELPFLADAGPDRELSDGSVLCRVDQLAAPAESTPSGDGWYYDDFSEDAEQACRGRAPARVAYSAGAEPPSGVRVILDCGQ